MMKKMLKNIINIIEEDYFKDLIFRIEKVCFETDEVRTFKELESSLEDTYSKVKCQNILLLSCLELCIWITVYKGKTGIDIEYLCWEIIYKSSNKNLKKYFKSDNFLNLNIKDIKGKMSKNKNKYNLNSKCYLECINLNGIEEDEDEYETIINFSKGYDSEELIFEDKYISENFIKEIEFILKTQREMMISNLNNTIMEKLIYE